MRAPTTVAAKLALQPRHTVWRVERCLAIDGVPAVVLRDYAPTSLHGKPFDPSPLQSLDSDLPGLFRAAGARLVRMAATYDACTADAEVAALLDVPAGHALLHADQDSFADTGTLVLTTDAY